MGCCIQGYEQAVEAEQQARNVIYLDQPEIVLGQELRNITPHLLAVLTVIKSPFYLGGAFDHRHVAQFLWSMHVNYSPHDKRGRAYMADVASHFSLDQCREEIGAFIDLTFMDMPTGGKPEKPIASNIAWLIFRFRHDPWRMKEPEIIHTPLRKLYQELRCWMREQDQDVPNKSDMHKATWIEQINEAMRTGVITQEQLDKKNAEWRAMRERN